MGPRKLNISPMGRKVNMNTLPTLTGLQWVEANSGRITGVFGGWWGRKGSCPQICPLPGLIVWLQWSSAPLLKSLLCRAGLSSATQAWCVSPGRNLASDGPHEHVLGLLPVLHLVVKNQPGNTGDVGSISWVGKILWRRKWQPTPVFYSPVFSPMDRGAWRGYSAQGHKELD